MLSITQSGIKSIFQWNYNDTDKDGHYERRDSCCPKKWKASFMDRKKTLSTQSQAMGNFFEHLVGANHNSEIKSLPLKRGNLKTEAHIRLEHQAHAFRGIRTKYGFSMDNVQVILRTPWLENRVELKGTFDIFDVTGKEPWNVDIKICANIESDFGEYQWAEPEKKDWLQAKFYDYIFFKKYKRHCNHLFLVFDYSPKMNIKEVSYEVTMEDHEQVEWLVNELLDLIVQWHKMKYPANPSMESCKNCPFGYKEMNKFEKIIHAPLTSFGDGSCEYKIINFKVKENENNL